jgi:hypothetical protein
MGAAYQAQGQSGIQSKNVSRKRKKRNIHILMLEHKVAKINPGFGMTKPKIFDETSI